MNIVYGGKETAYLAARDKRLGAAIAQIGHAERAADPDVFASVVHYIIGQQLSTAAQATVWRRLQDAAGTVDAASLLALDRAQLQALGMTFKRRTTSSISPGGSTGANLTSRYSRPCRTTRPSRS